MRAIQTIGNLALGFAAAGLLAGCGDDATGPGTGVRIRLAFRVGASTGGASPALLAAPCDVNMTTAVLRCTDGSTPPNTLLIESVQLVLREIEFERVETVDCDTAPDEDACEKFEGGPHLVDLPLDGSVEVTDIVDVVGDGVYDEVEFDIHKLDDDDPDDVAALNLWISEGKGDFTDLSIRVSTNFNGAGVQNFESDLNEEQEIELATPVTVSASTGLTELIGITFTVDLDSWFRKGDGTLIDPFTANKGELNENLVKDNIRDSIEGFRDDDHDGVAHEDDTDEDD